MAFNTWEGETCDLGGLWFQTDQNGCCQNMGSACAAALGVSPTGIIGQPLAFFTQKQEISEAFLWRKVVSDGRVYQAKVAVGAKGYSKASYQLTILGQYDKDGVITGYTGNISPDATSADGVDLYTQAFSLLEGLLRDIPHAVYWKDKDLVYRGASTYFAWCAGLNSPHDLVGKRDSQLAWTREQAESYESSDLQVLQTQEPLYNVHETQHRGSGELVEITTHRTPLVSDDGTILGVLGVQHELVAPKSTNYQVPTTPSKNSSEDKTIEILSKISHAIRSSVDGMLGMTRLLKNTGLSTEQEECTQGVERAATTLLSLLEEGLDYISLESGTFTPRSEQFNIDDLLLQTLCLLDPSIKSREVEFCCTLDEQIPDEFVGDQARLARLLFSLCGNAIWLMERGESGVLEVAQERQNDSTTLKFTVRRMLMDTPRVQRRSTSETTVAEETSSWLRGSMAHRLLLAMGGEMSVGSTAEELISFKIPLEPYGSDTTAKTLIVPIIENAKHQQRTLKDQTADNIQTDSPSTIASPNGQYRVLLVEDNPVSCRASQKLLEGLGLAVTVAQDGVEALELTEKDTFSVVLLDCDLPKINGYTVSKMLRRREQNSGMRTPIIALTAQALEEDKALCTQAGMDDYLCKPVSPKDLRSCLSKILGEGASPG